MSKLTLLLADANILLDLIHLGREECLSLIVQKLGYTILIPSRIQNEVKNEISSAQLVELGVTLLPVDLEVELMLAAEHTCRTFSSEALSDSDVQLLIEAKRKLGILWTGDRCLRKSAKAYEVQTMYFFEPLLELAACHHLKRKTLLEMAKMLQSENDWGYPKDLVDQLAQKLDERNIF